jgi:chromosome segregation ATPase
MEELDEVAAEALANLRDLERGLDDAERAVADLEEALDEAASGAQSAWDGFASALEESRELVRAHHAELSQADEQTHEALSGLGDRAQGASRASQESLARAERDLSTLRDQVAGLEAETLAAVGEAGERARALAERIASLDDELESLVSDATALLSEELPAELRAFTGEVRERRQAIENDTLQEALPRLEAESQELAAQLEGLQSAFRERIERVAESTEDAIRAAMSECQTEHEALLADLDLGIKDALGEMEAFARELQQGERTVQDAQEPLTSQAESTQGELGRALEALREAQAYFARSGFGRA